ncbi:MAG: hypothetical protein QM755_12240 [Luteolibacter sp.]
MRGSPLIRTLLLVGGLLLAGWGMLHFGGASATPSSSTPNTVAISSTSRAGFAVKLSAPAESLELKDRAGRVLFHGGSSDPDTGMIDLNTQDPVVYIAVRWKEAPPAGLNHFAKLTLEPSGKPTQVRYFEAPGDLDDVWELPVE